MDPTKHPLKAPIGGKPNRKNQNIQAKAAVAELRKRAQAAASSSQATNEKTFRELLGIVDCIIKDWGTQAGQIIGRVMDQGDRDICWAICFARLTQALRNIGRPVNQHVEVSIEELISHIKPRGTEKFELANLKIAIKHIATKGILKQPTTEKKSQEADAVGTRYQETFKIYQDVDADFLQARLDRYPVALIVDMDPEFSAVGEKGIYHLPKKPAVPKHLHSMILLGYGETKEGKRFFIGQNSYGENWGCKGYALIFIEEKCDIFCRQE